MTETKTKKTTATNKNLTLAQKLVLIQNELKVKKNQWNKFGKYPYRNLEDILGGVKPLLKKYDCVLTMQDEIMVIADRFYIKSTVTLRDCLTGEIIETSRFAREPEKLGAMAEPQITGTASTYAGKYAMSAMFLLDDIKDPDSNEHREEQKARKEAAEFEKVEEQNSDEELQDKRRKLKDKLLELNLRTVDDFTNLEKQALGTVKAKSKLTLNDYDALIAELEHMQLNM